MLERPGHNVMARFDQSVQGYAKGVGAVQREDDAGRIRRIEQPANLLPRLVDNPLGVRLESLFETMPSRPIMRA